MNNTAQKSNGNGTHVPLFPHSAGKNAKTVTIEVAPGRRVVDLPRELVRRVAIAEWIPQGDGTYKPVARVHDEEIPLTDDLPQRLGLGVSHDTLKRLIKAGFVRGCRVAPNRHIFYLQSYYDHVERVREDPDFWTRERLRDYMQAAY
jgi:hypothetical protein